MKKFEVGKTYSCFSIGNQDCIWSYEVVKRTACTVTITDGKEIKTLRINKQASGFRNSETVYPLGRYSMCPMLSA